MNASDFDTHPVLMDFYTRYGRAMAEWAGLEYMLAMWFAKATQTRVGSEIKNINSYGIFYSARSFNGRYDMLKAASNSGLLTDDERTFLRKALKRASDFNAFRGKLAHRMPLFKPFENPQHVALIEGDEWETDPITVEQIDNAAAHFKLLAKTLINVMASNGITPQEGHRRVGLLPKEPHLPVDSRLKAEFAPKRS